MTIKLTEIPQELLMGEIALYLNGNDLVTVSSVNKFFHLIFTSNVAWKNFIENQNVPSKLLKSYFIFKNDNPEKGFENKKTIINFYKCYVSYFRTSHNLSPKKPEGNPTIFDQKLKLDKLINKKFKIQKSKNSLLTNEIWNSKETLIIQNPIILLAIKAKLIAPSFHYIITKLDNSPIERSNLIKNGFFTNSQLTNLWFNKTFRKIKNIPLPLVKFLLSKLKGPLRKSSVNAFLKYHPNHPQKEQILKLLNEKLNN